MSANQGRSDAAAARARRRRRLAWALGAALSVGALVLVLEARGVTLRDLLGAFSASSGSLARLQRSLNGTSNSPASVDAPPPGSRPQPGTAGVGSALPEPLAARAAAGSNGEALAGAAGAGADLLQGASAGGDGAEPSAGNEPEFDAVLAGRVLDVTGGPVAGARVKVHFLERMFARWRETGEIASVPAPDAEWVTDSAGDFRGQVPAGNVSLEASADAYASASKGARAPAQDVVIVLAPGGSISGRVQRTDGTPVTGANVRARPRGLEHQPLEVTSDAGGAFSISGVPSGVVELSASASGLSSAREWLRLGLAEASAPVVLTLQAAHSVQGVVRGEDGTVCTGGMVHAGGLGRMARVDAQGRYRIDGLELGTWTLGASCPRLAGQERSVEVSASSPAVIDVDWELATGFALAGIVRHDDGRPAPNVNVFVIETTPPGSGSAAGERFVARSATSCISDAAGEFTCRGLAAGWHRASANTVMGVSDDAGGVTVFLDANNRERVTLTLAATGEVLVRLASGDGNVGGLAQGIYARGALPYPLLAQPREGGYVFERLPLGRYRISIGHGLQEPGPSAVDVELVQSGQIVEVELRVPERRSIAGVVVDAQGEPVPDAWVQASAADGATAVRLRANDAALTGLDGAFEIAELVPSRYTLRATHSSGEGVLPDVAAGARGVRLSLQGYGALSGRVSTPRGEPVSVFTVLLVRQQMEEVMHVDGELGRWSMPYVPAGEYRVVAMAREGGAMATARVTPDANRELSLKLDPALTGKALQDVMSGAR